MTMASQGRRQNRWKPLFNILANSGITGLSRVGSESSIILKVFWLMLFVFGAIGFGVYFSLIYFQFQREPIITQIKNHDTDFTWPHITLCHPNNPIAFWKKPSLKEVWESYRRKARKVRNSLKGVHKGMSVQELILASVDRNKFYNIGFRGNIYGVTQRHQSGYTPKRKNSNSPHTESESENGFDDHLRTRGFPIPCYTLKPERMSDKHFEQNISMLKGIRLFLILDYDSYQFLNLPDSNDLYLYVSNPNHTNTNSEVYYISSGTTYRFHITESKFISVEDCRHGDYMVEIYDSLMQKTYKLIGSYEDCRYQLLQTIYYRLCGCYNPSIPIYKVERSIPRLCPNMTIYTESEIIKNYRCINKIKKEHDHKKFELLVNEKCGVYLKPKCNQTTYSIDLQKRPWARKSNPNLRWRLKSLAKKLPNFDPSRGYDPDTFLLDNTAEVDFYRKKKKASLIFQERLYPLPKFLSDVGGLLALCLGLSCIGVFELIDLIIRILLSAITALRNKTK